MWNPTTCDFECNKACKTDEYLDIKNCSCGKRLIGKLVLSCEDEILNTTENSLDNEKVTCAKNNYIIHKISLVIICFLLLVVISVSCYYYYTRDWIKKEYSLLYLYKMNGLKENNVTYYFFYYMIYIENLDLNKIEIGKKLYKNILIYITLDT